jgi:transposase
MHFIQGTPREQIVLFNECLDSSIDSDNAVRVIDAYVEKLDLSKIKFRIPELKTGKPPYRPQVLLKIYIYGYLEKIRSSRKLEKECIRNKELIWLTENLAPDFKTIADFRKENIKGIRNVFKEFLLFCKIVGILSLSTIGIDSTKMRGQNSPNNVFKRDEIDNIEKRIEEKIAEYLAKLKINDLSRSEEIQLDDGEEARQLVKKLKKLNKYQDKVKSIKELFEKDPDLKVYFANDTDSRFQSDKGKVRPGYNPQIAVDDKTKIIVANDVTNKSNDLEQMTPMVERVQELKEEFNVKNNTNAIMDAGYFSEKEILNNKDKDGINIIVSDSKEAEEKNKKCSNKARPDKIPAEGYEAKDFIYDKELDIYICQEGKKLHKPYNTKPLTDEAGRQTFEYRCKDCNNCEKRNRCTKNKRGRTLKISVNLEKMENYKKEIQAGDKKHLISKRKEIVEHPFGTMKRNMGYTYFMQVGMEKVKAEFSFICFVYNFKRVLNLFGMRGFTSALNAYRGL